MATHSSVLAWRIPWIEEPGRLPSMGITDVTEHACTLSVVLKFSSEQCSHF